jgi:outer membrane protein assembly factor BamB
VDVPYPVWYSFPALDSENVYFASSYFTGQGVQLHFTALNRLTGQEVWTYEDEMDIGTRVTFDQENLFLRHIELLDYMAPSLWNNLVIFTSGDTVVRAFEAKTGKIAWRKTFSHPTSSAPTVAGDRIYFGLRGDEGGHSGLFGEEEPQLVCIAAKNGDVLWKTPTEGAVLNSPVISGKRILFGTDARLFYVLEEIF